MIRDLIVKICNFFYGVYEPTELDKARYEYLELQNRKMLLEQQLKNAQSKQDIEKLENKLNRLQGETK